MNLREAGILSFLYAMVCVVEGTGLMLEKRWAEYFTVILTALGLPWEIYELAHKYSPYKVGLMVINVAVLVYLVWILKKRRTGPGCELRWGRGRVGHFRFYFAYNKLKAVTSAQVGANHSR